MDQLQPIAEILGPNSVTADYSQHQRFGSDVYRAGWRVIITGQYRGTQVKLTKVAATLDEAAGAALAELKKALGLT